MPDVVAYLRERTSTHQRGAEEPQMFENSNPFLQPEMDYRRDRIRSNVVQRKNRHVRKPFVRRPAESSDNAR
jgi:hypothetical protein